MRRRGVGVGAVKRKEKNKEVSAGSTHLPHDRSGFEAKLRLQNTSTYLVSVHYCFLSTTGHLRAAAQHCVTFAIRGSASQRYMAWLAKGYISLEEKYS